MDSSSLRNRTVIGHDCHIRGEIWLDNDLTILGQVDGTVQVGGVLEIGPGAWVQGRILCSSLRLAGQVEAEVVAEESCELLAGSVLSGSLYTRRLVMAPEARLEARVCIGPQALEQASQLVETALIEEPESSREEPERQSAGGIANMEEHGRAEDMKDVQAAQHTGEASGGEKTVQEVQKLEPVVTVPSVVQQALAARRPARIIRTGKMAS